MSRFNMLTLFSERGGRDTEHGGLLHWPGHPDTGIPFRGDYIPDLRKSEIDNLEVAADFRSRMFELWNEADKKAFDKIMQCEAVGWFMIRVRREHFDEKHNHYRIWLEWLQLYTVLPNGVGADEY